MSQQLYVVVQTERIHHAQLLDGIPVLHPGPEVDLGAWMQNGYAIKELCVVDAFGLNHHVELLAHLVPARGGRGG